MGAYNGKDYLTSAIGDLGFKVFIHEYIYNHEIIYHDHASQQLEKLIESGNIKVIYENSLSSEEKNEYKSICELIAPVLKADLSKHRDRNVGEVKSLAIAYVKKYGYFISDDKKAAIVSNDNLVYLDNTKIETIKLKDIMIRLKITGNYKRSELRKLFIYYANPNLHVISVEIEKAKRILIKLKKTFDIEIWPID